MNSQLTLLEVEPVAAVEVVDDTPPLPDEGKVKSARGIIELLRRRHPTDKGEWAVFVELPVATGGGAQRLDMFVMNLWPSKRFRTIAYEIKISRSDFMHEIKEPAKREMAENVGGECYFVVPHGMIKKDEVPEGWGLLYATDTKLTLQKVATQRTPAPYPMHFVAALARRGADVKPDIPEGVWEYEGRVMNYEMLEQFADRLLEHKRQALQSKAIANYRNWGIGKWGDMLYEAFRKVFPDAYLDGMKPKEVEALLRGDTTVTLNQYERDELERAYKAMQRILHKAEDEG